MKKLSILYAILFALVVAAIVYTYLFGDKHDTILMALFVLVGEVLLIKEKVEKIEVYEEDEEEDETEESE